MATVLTSPIDLPEPEEADTGVRPYRWTVEDFYRAIDARLFKHPERLELIDGEIIEKVSPQQTPHSQATIYCRDETERVFKPMGHVRTQMPLDVGQRTEPEPDVMVVRGSVRDYDHRKPTPADVLLVIEVSDTTLGYDRHRKAALYAEAGIADYWVLDLNARCLEVHRDPGPMPHGKHGYGYKTILRCAEGESVSPLRTPDAVIRVSDLLPRSTE